MNEQTRPPPNLKARLMAAAAREVATPPGTWTRRVALTIVSGAAWLAVILIAKGLRHDWRELPAGTWSLTVAALVLSAGIATAMVLRRGRTMVGSGVGALAPVVWGLPLAMAVLVSAVDPCGPSTERVAEAGGLAAAGGCIGVTALAALPLIALGLLLFRGLTLSRPALSGAGLGLAAATWAHAVVRVHCPIGGADHALLGHLLPALPLMAIAAWASWALDRRAIRLRGR
jgi:hypothetical protein